MGANDDAARYTPPADAPRLPEAWSYQPLSAVVDPDRGISYGVVQPGHDDLTGIPIVRGNNLRPGRVDTSDALRVSTEIEATYKRSRLCGGEVLLTLVGHSLGDCAVASMEAAGWNVARAVGVIPVKPEIGGRWVCFCLRSPTLQRYMRTWATTTAQPTLNLRDVSQLPIMMPPPAERTSIVGILGALDDKIELNRRLNHTLEATARALFHSWFVAFDPVHAKAQGIQPSGLDAATAALFPDHFDDSPLGPIPSGWRVSTIGEAVNVVGGSTPSTQEPKFWNGSIHWATPKDLSGLENSVLLDTERRISEEGLGQISSGLLPKGAVLLSSRAPIGYLAIAETPVAVNQGFIAMVCDRDLPNHYVLRWAEANMELIKGRANGTTFMEVSKANFRPLLVTVPPTAVLERFSSIVESIYRRVVHNAIESRTLAATRDALLPRLLSGELRVPAAEHIAEEVVSVPHQS